MDKNTNGLLLASSPHIASPVSSRTVMRNMYIALAPICIFSVVIFGLPALLNIIVSVTAAIAGETLFRLAIRRDIRIKDLSAGITGLLLALIIPPSMPLWMTALGSIFAVVVAKEFFGGLGANVFNPALIGRAFLLMSFPAAMTTWHDPQEGFTLTFADAVSTASPLGMAQNGELPLYRELIVDMLLGFRAGSSGETSIILILGSCVFLLVTKTINWRIPVSMVVTACITAFFLGMDPLFVIISGGLMFGAVFMATDYTTSPMTPWGKVIFGAGAGLIAMLIRKYGTYPEGVCYALLIMNCTVPFLNRILPRKYGFVPAKKGGAK